VPDRRAIRWYTTIGLVDRPASTRGRTALYGERHLLQLVAIKRLQAAGRSLAQIQAELAGATEGALRSLARLPHQQALPSAPPAAPRTARFWSAPPTPVVQPAASAVSATAAVEDVLAAATSDPYLTPHAPAAVRPLRTAPRLPTADTAPQEIAPDRAEGAAAGRSAAPAVPATGAEDALAAMAEVPATAGVAPAVALPGGVTLLLPAGTPYPAASDLTAIRTAAVPLLAELGRRGVIATDPTEGRS
jgi:DNA-binding transcriptional MerR regulator